MKLELLEKLLSELAPAAAKAPIKKAFVGIQTATAQVVLLGLTDITATIKKDSDESVAAINGLVLGIALAYGTEVSPDLVKMIEGYLEMRQKERGSNIVDFFQARAGKV